MKNRMIGYLDFVVAVCIYEYTPMYIFKNGGGSARVTTLNKERFKTNPEA